MSMDLDFELNADRLREECGVFGIYGHPDAAALTALGLHALQHRGQEAAGIVSFDGERFQTERRLGLDQRPHWERIDQPETPDSLCLPQMHIRRSIDE